MVKGNGKKKVKLWDIEATNLNANFGFVLSVAVKDLGEDKVRVYSIDQYPSFKHDPTDDRALLKDACEDLSDAGAWVTWYGQRFDVPYINSRQILHQRAPMPQVPHIDGWRIAREKMALNSNRLASVSTFLGVQEKTPLNGPIWVRASAGHKPSLKYIVEHNVQDVIVLEEVYRRIRPLISNGPNLALLETGGSADAVPGNACPICGEGRVVRRGFGIAKTGRYQRYQCNGCGGWSKGKVERVEGVEAR